MVYYLKYRPQTIHDLDNARVRETLQSVLIRLDSTPHAFLFTGPKGLGKTSTARIVAKIINCEERKEGSLEPCNTCNQCMSITNGSNVDIIEIDAASNRGIDEMRDLKEKIRLSPAQATKKVYIIDEVHMLTTEAFNALLKTLEEPPAHAMFILCTTESHKIPSTILSRCFHVAFSKATNEELVRSFKRIAKGEELYIDDDVLVAVARLSDGGFRDGAKMLEELVALSSGDKVTLLTLEKLYKTTSIDQAIIVLCDSLAIYDLPSCLKLISKLVSEGVDIAFFINQLVEFLHSELLIHVGIVSGEETKTTLDTSSLQALLTLLMRAGSDMRYAVMPQLPLELAILEWCSTHGDTAVAPKPIVDKKAIKKEEEVVETIEIAKTTLMQPAGTTVASMRKQVGNMMKVKALYGEPKIEIEVQKVNKLSLDAYNNVGPLSTEWLQEFWRCMIEQMKTHNHTIAGVLRGCTLNSFDKTTLIIETAYKFHQEKLVDNKIKQLLEATCKELVGKPIVVSILLKQ